MKKCPKCGNNLTEIIYGMPAPELFEAAERGEVILGGCCLSGDDPKYHCKKCKVGFSRDLKKEYKDQENEE